MSYYGYAVVHVSDPIVSLRNDWRLQFRVHFRLPSAAQIELGGGLEPSVVLAAFQIPIKLSKVLFIP